MAILVFFSSSDFLYANTMGVKALLFGLLGTHIACLKLGFLIFVAILLIWIGGSMIISHIVGDKSTRSDSLGGGGTTALIGLLLLGAVQYIKS